MYPAIPATYYALRFMRRVVITGFGASTPVGFDAPYGASGMNEAMFSSGRFVRLSRLKTLLDAGRLDGELRWCLPAEAVSA
jgi:hypothetical protein